MSKYLEEMAALFGTRHNGSYGNECITMNGYRIGVGSHDKEVCLWVEMPDAEGCWKVTLPADDAAILHMHLGAALKRMGR